MLPSKAKELEQDGRKIFASTATSRHAFRQVAVITNGLKVVLELEVAMPDVTVIVTGGTPRRLRRAGAEVIQVE